MAAHPPTRLRIQLDGGDASLPKLAQNLGPTGINPVQVKQEFDAATHDHRGLTVPVDVEVHDDRSFTLHVRTPQTAALLRRAAGVARGAGRPGTRSAGRITRAQLREVAALKLPDLNTADLGAAERIVAGSARSMGLEVVD